MFLVDSKIILRMMNYIVSLSRVTNKVSIEKKFCVIVCLDMNIRKMTSEMVFTVCLLLCSIQGHRQILFNFKQ